MFSLAIAYVCFCVNVTDERIPPITHVLFLCTLKSLIAVAITITIAIANSSILLLPRFVLTCHAILRKHIINHQNNWMQRIEIVSLQIIDKNIYMQTNYSL